MTQTTILETWKYRDPSLASSLTQSEVLGYDVVAIDGSIGKIDDTTLDADSGHVVVDTGPWIFGKKVMLPAGVITSADHAGEKVFVNRTKDEIKSAPEFDDSFRFDEKYTPSSGRTTGAEAAVTATGTELTQGARSLSRRTSDVGSGRASRAAGPASPLTGGRQMLGRTKESQMDRATNMMRDVVKYTQATAQDQRLRADLRAALNHGSKASDQLKKDIRAGSIYTRLAADKNLRKNLREMLDDLDDAGRRMRRGRSHRIRNALVVLAGAVAAALAFPRVRPWIEERASGHRRDGERGT